MKPSILLPSPQANSQEIPSSSPGNDESIFLLSLPGDEGRWSPQRAQHPVWDTVSTSKQRCLPHRGPPGWKLQSFSLDLRKDSGLETGKTTFPLLILITQRGTSQRSWWRATETGAVTELKYLPSVVCNRDWQAPLFWVNHKRSLRGLCLVLLVLSLISVFTGPKCESGPSLVTTET